MGLCFTKDIHQIFLQILLPDYIPQPENQSLGPLSVHVVQVLRDFGLSFRTEASICIVLVKVCSRPVKDGIQVAVQ